MPLHRPRSLTWWCAAAAAGLWWAPPVPAQTVQRVEITGTAQPLAEEALRPGVSVVRAADLARAGITTAEQALRRIAANQPAQGLSQGVGEFTGGISEADLRGLGADKTLVLLNGRRLANHAYDAGAVDLNAIPMAAVDRIEVLREGASAQYGSGAIAGVVNFILRRDVAGFEVAAETEQPQGPGGGAKRASVTAGLGQLGSDAFNAFLTLDMRSQSTLAGLDRAFSKSGVPTGRTRGASFPGSLDGFDPSFATGCAPPRSVPDSRRGSCRYDFMQDVDLIPRNRQATLLGQASVVLGAGHIATLEALHADNRTLNRQTPTPATMLLPDSSPYWPAGRPSTELELANGDTVQGGVVHWLLAPAGRRTHDTHATAQRVLAALEGSGAGLDYRAALGHARSTVRDTLVSGHVDASAVQAALLDGRLNPFGAQTEAGNAALAASQLMGPLLHARGDVTTFDARVSKGVVSLPGGALSLALGAAARYEKFGYALTALAARTADLELELANNVRGTRRVHAVLGDITAPLTPELTLTLAAMQERSSDSGSVRSPKLALRWRPLGTLLLRASASADYRAPTLYEVHAPQALEETGSEYDDPLLCPGGVPVAGVADALVCRRTFLQRTGRPVTVGAASPPLRPERSQHRTLGAVFEPAKGVAFGIDLWRLRLRDVIDVLPDQAVFEDPVRQAARIVRCSQLGAAERARLSACLNAGGTDLIAYIDTPTQNLGRVHAQGVDLSVALASGPTPQGEFGFTFEASRIGRYDYQRESGGRFSPSVRRFAGDMPVIRWQHLAQGTWQRGDWSSALSQRYKSRYRDQDGTRKVAGYGLVDASVTYTAIPHLTLSAGVKNVFNRAPPYTVQDATLQVNYDPRTTDPVGRAFTLRAAYEWR